MSMNMKEMIMRLNVNENLDTNKDYVLKLQCSIERGELKGKQIFNDLKYGINNEYTHIYDNRHFRLSYLTALQEQMESKINELNQKIKEEIEKEIEFNNNLYQKNIDNTNKEVRLSIIKNKHKDLADKFDLEKFNNLPKDLIEYEIKPYLGLEFLDIIKTECRIKHWLYDTDNLCKKMNQISYANITIISRDILYKQGKTKKQKIDLIIAVLKNELKYFRVGGGFRRVYLNHLLLFKSLIMLFPTYTKKIDKKNVCYIGL